MGSQSHQAMLLILVQILLSLAATNSDLAADRAALLSLRSAVGGRTLLWNTTDPSPCKWAGVQCDAADNRVTALRLPGVSLSGQVPTGTVGSLTGLRTLSLRFNSLTGGIPADLPSCTELRNLYLQGNNFSGDLPEFLFSLHRFVRLNLAGNSFSGQIPAGFNNLIRLRTLYLENNRFHGSIPSLSLPDLVQFNVSFNQLNGSVPASLKSMPAAAFAGNLLCGEPLASCSGNRTSSATTGNGTSPATAGGGNSNNRKSKKKGLPGGAIAGIVIGSVLSFVLILLILLFLCRKKSSKKTSSIDIATIKPQEAETRGDKPVGEEEIGGLMAVGAAADGKREVGNGGGEKKLVFFGGGRGFDLEDLLRASAEVLGKGTFGTAYKAVLEVGTVVAVKRLKDVVISEREFREKIETVGAMDNGNLVPLRAYYFSREEKLLVYDYMPMGSLSALLHGNKGSSRTPLNWEIRSGIALGAARGIEYLHSQGPNVSHGNIKSSNILLTKSYDAKVSDFGLAHLVGPSSTPNRVAGYRAPEVTDPRKVSQKADVYSYGVLILELLTGKAPTHALLNEEGVDLPRWVQSIVKEEWSSEVFDVELLRYQNLDEDMVQLLQLAIDCAAQYPDKRPSMSQVVRRIEELCGSRGDDQDSQPDRVNEAD